MMEKYMEINIGVPKFNSLAGALAEIYGKDIRLGQSFRIPGGDINKAYGMQLSNGKILFMKTNEKQKVDLFLSEAINLWAISLTNTINTPKLLAYGTDDSEEIGYSFLLMEYIELGDIKDEFWNVFAEKLASMHKADTSSLVKNGKFGFLQDNFIGRTQQINLAKDSWVEFFRDNRLVPQFKMAEKYFEKDDFSKMDKLLNKLDKILVEPEKPSLLHGDLWGGNVLCDTKSLPLLIDPACYVGHPEADIAMTELFGGFSGKFYDAYKNTGLLQSGYSERRDLYNLYHILNHLNMFGKTYLSAARSIIDSYL